MALTEEFNEAEVEYWVSYFTVYTPFSLDILLKDIQLNRRLLAVKERAIQIADQRIKEALKGAA